MLITETKVDPRVKRTYRLLQQALNELLTEKDFHNVTVQDIAERAEVNRATFYAHFEDKYALLHYHVRETFQERLDMKLTGEPAFTRENLRLLTLTACEYLGDFLGRCTPSPTHSDRATMVRKVQSHIYDVVYAWLTASVAKGKKQDISPEVVSSMISWTIFGAVFEWVKTGRKLPAASLTEQVLTALTHGLQAYLD